MCFWHNLVSISLLWHLFLGKEKGQDTGRETLLCQVHTAIWPFKLPSNLREAQYFSLDIWEDLDLGTKKRVEFDSGLLTLESVLWNLLPSRARYINREAAAHFACSTCWLSQHGQSMMTAKDKFTVRFTLQAGVSLRFKRCCYLNCAD